MQTLYKTSDPVLARSAGLATFNARYKLICLPLWVCLQNLGHEGVVARVQYSIELVSSPQAGWSHHYELTWSAFRAS